jgi:hypothetical protein
MAHIAIQRMHFHPMRKAKAHSLGLFSYLPAPEPVDVPVLELPVPIDDVPSVPGLADPDVLVPVVPPILSDSTGPAVPVAFPVVPVDPLVDVAWSGVGLVFTPGTPVAPPWAPVPVPVPVACASAKVLVIASAPASAIVASFMVLSSRMVRGSKSP